VVFSYLIQGAIAHVAWVADDANVKMGFTDDDRILVENLYIIADRTNGRAYATVLSPSSVVVCEVVYCG